MNSLAKSPHLFTHISYTGDNFTPQFHLLPPSDGLLTQFTPLGKTLTLKFDTTQRLCTGWHDLATQTSYPCPDKAPVDGTYSECRSCQQKTGFNPAFYYSDTISPQQQARNQEPHMLYLAHFAPGVVKVGITYAKRDIRRLLDQGARSCLIIKTFPTADIARQYEAKIAALPGIAETLQSRQKTRLLSSPYNPTRGTEELQQTRERIASEVGLNADDVKPLYLDKYYFSDARLKSDMLIDLNDENYISGRVVGIIGGILITEQDDAHFMFNLNKRRGHHATLTSEEVPNQHAPQQASLF